jgi:hypothetical protein
MCGILYKLVWDEKADFKKRKYGKFKKIQPCVKNQKLQFLRPVACWLYKMWKKWLQDVTDTRYKTKISSMIVVFSQSNLRHISFSSFYKPTFAFTSSSSPTQRMAHL